MRHGLNIAFFGSSLVSAYWNGAATYYRGIIRALHERGHRVTFYEPDAYERQQHRDIPNPDWAKVVVYDGAGEAGVRQALRAARGADVVIKASGVGFEDNLLLEEVLRAAKPQALKIFWDVDAPATLRELRAAPDHPLRRALSTINLVLTYGGGDPVVDAYRAMGTRDCIPIYNALDPQTHHPVARDVRFNADLGFLGNRLPDREARVLLDLRPVLIRGRGGQQPASGLLEHPDVGPTDQQLQPGARGHRCGDLRSGRHSRSQGLWRCPTLDPRLHGGNARTSTLSSGRGWPTCSPR